VIVNLQRKRAIDKRSLDEFRERLLNTVPEADGRSVAVALISDRRMKELNRLFRGSDGTTDVLSFPYESDGFDPDKTNLGDIVISVEQADRQAEDNGLTLEGEIRQLMLHGLLHLCGYDHETDNGEMDLRELELREQMGI
jgi:probable rRNA maturation factor